MQFSCAAKANTSIEAQDYTLAQAPRLVENSHKRSPAAPRKPLRIGFDISLRPVLDTYRASGHWDSTARRTNIFLCLLRATVFSQWLSMVVFLV